MKHTDGPWEAVGASVHATSGKEIIHWRYNTRNGTEQEQEANARLIAAAPELLEALKIVLVQYGEYQDGQGAAKFHAVNIARDAIAKAEGKED